MSNWIQKTVYAGCLVLSSLMTVSAQTAAPPGQAAAQEAEVRAFIREVDAALKTRDRSALERVISEGFTHLHSTGNLETRQSFIDRAAAGSLMSQRVPADSLEDTVRIYDGRTALRTTKTRARVPQQNREPVEMNVRSIDVYVKIDGHWLWVSEQSTPLPVRPRAVAVDARTIAAYVGAYEIDATRSLVVSTDGSILKAVATGRQPVELIPRSPREFAWFNPDVNVQAELAFIVDAADRVTGVVFRQDGQEIWRAKKVR